MALFLFLGPKPRGLNFAEIYARGGRGLQRPTFRDLIPPWGHSHVGPGRGGTAPFGAGRSPEHTGLCWGGGRGARRAGAAGRRGHTRSRGGGAGGAGRGHTRAGRGRAAARARWARKPGRVGAAARRAGGSPGRGGARCVGQTRPNPGGGRGRGAAALRRGLCQAAARGAGPGRQRWTLRHSALSPAACVGSGAHPVRAAARRAGKALFRYIRKRAGRRAFVCQIRAVLAR